MKSSRKHIGCKAHAVPKLKNDRVLRLLLRLRVRSRFGTSAEKKLHGVSARNVSAGNHYFHRLCHLENSDGVSRTRPELYHPITQTLNLRLAASRDGRKWWFPDRPPCLDKAPLGEYGGGMLRKSKNLVLHDGRFYVYYGAMEGSHRSIMDTRGEGFRQIGTDTPGLDEGSMQVELLDGRVRGSCGWGSKSRPNSRAAPRATSRRTPAPAQARCRGRTR